MKGEKYIPDYYEESVRARAGTVGSDVGVPRTQTPIEGNRPNERDLVDFFHGENQFSTTGESLSAYFLRFACAARRTRV